MIFLRIFRLENEPKTRFEPFVDDLTSEEVLIQVQNAAAKAKKALSERKRASKMGFLRQKKDGTTSMQILVDVENSCPERIVSLGAFIGKLQSGTGQLHSFREDRRNNAKIVKPLNYGTYCSFAPIYDSRFANLSKEESELVLNTYGKSCLGNNLSKGCQRTRVDEKKSQFFAFVRPKKPFRLKGTYTDLSADSFTLVAVHRHTHPNDSIPK